MISELGVRWLLAGILVLVSGWAGTPEFGLALPLALSWAALATVSLRLDRASPGVAGAIAVIDGVFLAALTSGIDRTSSLGWLACLPMVHAATRFGASSISMAPLVAFGLLGVHGIIHKTVPAPNVYFPVAGALLLGLALMHRRPVDPAPSEWVGSTDPLGKHEPETMLGLRESFRKLKGLYRQLERQTRSDRVKAKLLEVRIGPDDGMTDRLADRIRELTGAERASIYAVTGPSTLRALGEHDGAPVELSMETAQSLGRIRHTAHRLLADPASPNASHVVPLSHEGRVLGVCALTLPSGQDLLASVGEEWAPLAAALLAEAHERRAAAHERRMAELRLDLAVSLRGAIDRGAVVERFLSRLSTIFKLDDVELWASGGCLGRVGRDLSGGDWLPAPCFLPRVSDHPEVSALATLRRIGGVFSATAGSLKLVGATIAEGVLPADAEWELSVLLTDLVWLIEHVEGEPTGVLGSADFKERLKVPGVLILFEVREKALRSAAELVQTGEQLRHRVLDSIPMGASLHVREDGELLVHLQGWHVGEAEGWARSVSQVISGVRIRSASLWPRMNALISDDVNEPELGYAQSKV